MVKKRDATRKRDLHSGSNKRVHWNFEVVDLQSLAGSTSSLNFILLPLIESIFMSI